MKKSGDESASGRLVFVYGSLKRGFCNHHFLDRQTFIGPHRTAPIYRMYDYGGFPAVVETGPGGASIEGEIWRVEPKGLLRLDWLEDIDRGLYRRAWAELIDPPAARVLIYLYAQDIRGLPEVGSSWPIELDTGGASEIPENLL